MKIKARIRVRDKYVGDSNVYLTVTDRDGGEFKIGGPFHAVPVDVPLVMEGEFKGRLIGREFFLNGETVKFSIDAEAVRADAETAALAAKSGDIVATRVG